MLGLLIALLIRLGIEIEKGQEKYRLFRETRLIRLLKKDNKEVSTGAIV